MKALTFTLVAEPPERLDLSPLTPQGLAGLDRRAIEKIRLGQSKRASVVGDIFRVAGSDVADHRLRRRQQPLRPRGGRD